MTLHVWCLECQHEHISTIPSRTWRCSKCGFGAWDNEIALNHAVNLLGHAVYQIQHRLSMTRPEADPPTPELDDPTPVPHELPSLPEGWTVTSISFHVGSPASPDPTAGLDAWREYARKLNIPLDLSPAPDRYIDLEPIFTDAPAGSAEPIFTNSLVDLCGCGHPKSAHENGSGPCSEWYRYPQVALQRECGCVQVWAPIQSAKGEQCTRCKQVNCAYAGTYDRVCCTMCTHRRPGDPE